MAQSNRTILIADNRPEYLKTMKEFFEVEGYDVRAAENPTEARRVLETEQPDLAILDLRLLDNDDEKDLSGIEVAMDTAPEVPKIILTDFPNWQTVRAALGPADNGGRPAVDYVAKSEGPEALLRAVRLTLLSLSPEFEKNLLQAFKVPATVALRNRLNEVGVEDTAMRLREAYESTSSEMRAHRERESARASRLHMWGLIASLVGIALIFVAIGFFIAGVGAGVVVTLVGDAVAAAVGVLFSRREDVAHKRVESYYKKLDELSLADKTLAICESLASAEARDECKKKVIDYLLSGK